MLLSMAGDMFFLCFSISLVFKILHYYYLFISPFSTLSSLEDMDGVLFLFKLTASSKVLADKTTVY